MKLIIGSDHGAVDLKEEVKRVLKEEFAEVEVEDVGTFGTESVDYPDVAEKVCTPVANGDRQQIQFSSMYARFHLQFQNQLYVHPLLKH